MASTTPNLFFSLPAELRQRCLANLLTVDSVHHVLTAMGMLPWPVYFFTGYNSKLQAVGQTLASVQPNVYRADPELAAELTTVRNKLAHFICDDEKFGSVCFRWQKTIRLIRQGYGINNPSFKRGLRAARDRISGEWREVVVRAVDKLNEWAAGADA